MRIAFAVSVNVRVDARIAKRTSNVRVFDAHNLPPPSTSIVKETYLTIVSANISSDSEEKDRLAFHAAGETACTEAIAYFKEGYRVCDVFEPTILHFQIIP
ncbi:MAG: hypothetical protein A2845_03855 [Candidatus Lloydbacteria bacterium RIFCSPHIGHO2_01_FULL_49_22]|uniref:Uncharacterized protein n=1 Tax=Candidatus Lloydbacteria bacterium RIFCSPHIGHO2_01_FULL_49_22 TaxID=1798658 RepID=A0A1G2CZH1_9BACT|nr:MAG: hypothetical protein A2845_03855 [Candidatus Lloydbacteria bacterium RIFCSPHIGHO2_01_FULL_49_22]OGZ09061.1 MAG: hypothetical protein A3C14_03690 [Candidatus Lloydbacteria bacterium RIFCSPHIGHO2_02_FULL_50_18]